MLHGWQGNAGGPSGSKHCTPREVPACKAWGGFDGFLASACSDGDDICPGIFACRRGFNVGFGDC